MLFAFEMKKPSQLPCCFHCCFWGPWAMSNNSFFSSTKVARDDATLPQIQPPRMTKTRPHFTRCIEHFFRGEEAKNEGRCHCQILHHFYGHIFLADERRNEAILGLQKSVQHHLHHCRTNFLKLRQNSSFVSNLYWQQMNSRIF